MNSQDGERPPALPSRPPLLSSAPDPALSNNNANTANAISPQRRSQSPQLNGTSSSNVNNSASKKASKKWKKNLEFMDSTNSDWFDNNDDFVSTKSPPLTNEVKNSSEKRPDSSQSISKQIISASTSNINKIRGKASPTKQTSESKTAPNSPTKKDGDWVVVGEDDKADIQAEREVMNLNSKIAKIEKFYHITHQDNMDLEQLRQLSWNGIPEEFRAIAWKLLMGYMPTNLDRREPTLAKKRSDYQDYVAQSFGKGEKSLDQTIWHQITIDIPRTNPSVKLYQNQRVQQALQRILYCWAIRHPASGYVQGINDIATPFFQVFLSENADQVAGKFNAEAIDIDKISDDVLSQVEADTFWCVSKLLDGIQDNYTHAQPGIIRQISKMKELVGRIDGQLLAHLKQQNIEFIQFSFRWINCLLMRELPMRHVIRMWDTYIAEPDGFSNFHVYVCAAFLVRWSKQLRQMDFQDLIIFLQSPPTKNWQESDLELLLSESYMWKSLFHNSPGHLAKQQPSTISSDWSI